MGAEIAKGELLELRTELGGSFYIAGMPVPGGLRYYLAGKPIHAGEMLEMLLDDGSWALGRFEWNYRKEEWPWFYVDTESGDTIDLNPECSRLRWPDRSL
jgi:hypothetical protein